MNFLESDIQKQVIKALDIAHKFVFLPKIKKMNKINKLIRKKLL